MRSQALRLSLYLVTSLLFVLGGCCEPEPLPVPSQEPFELLESLQTTIGGQPAYVSLSSARVNDAPTFPVQIAFSRALVSFCVPERPVVRVDTDVVRIGSHVLEFADQGGTLRYGGSTYELAVGGAYLFGDGVYLGRVR